MQFLDNLDLANVAKIINLPQATAAGQPMEYSQVNALLEGLAWKDNVKAGLMSNINLSSPGATIDGVTMTLNDEFLAGNQTTASESGIYVWNGAAVAATRSPKMNLSSEFNSAIVPVDAGGATLGNTTWRCTTTNPTVGTTSITFTSFIAAAPNTSETVAGTIETATQAEVDAGTLDLLAVTPLKLANYVNKKLKNVTTIGDGSSTQFTVTHNFGTQNLIGQVRRTGTPFDVIGVTVSFPTVNTAQVNFATGLAPSANQYTVVILG